MLFLGCLFQSMFNVLLQTNPKWSGRMTPRALSLSLALRTAHVLLLIIFKIFTIQSNHKSHSQTHAHSIKCCKTRERGYRESTRRPYKIRDFFLVLISIWLVLFSLSHIYTFWWDFDLIWFLILSQYMYQNQCRAKNTLGIRCIDWFAANKFTSIRMKFCEQHSREQMKTSIDGPHVRRPLSYTQSRTHTHTRSHARETIKIKSIMVFAWTWTSGAHFIFLLRASLRSATTFGVFVLVGYKLKRASIWNVQHLLFRTTLSIR